MRPFRDKHRACALSLLALAACSSAPIEEPGRLLPDETRLPPEETRLEAPAESNSHVAGEVAMRLEPDLTPVKLGPAGGSAQFYSAYTATGAATPSSVMLDELGKVSLTIKNQGTNGGCWGFADVAVLESEYVSEYGLPAATFSLSEQYNIFDAIKGYWGESDTYGDSVNAAIGSFELMSHYGLPPEASDPVNLQGPWNAIPRVLGPAYAVANPQSLGYLNSYAQTGVADSTWLTSLGNYIGQSPVANDLTRFNAASLAPLNVHEQAAYAPTSAAWVALSTKYPTGGANNCLDPNSAGDTTVNCQNVFPFEEVINQGHTIRFEMTSDPQDWLQNPTTGVYGYNPNGGHDGHVVALVGYDRQRQVFRFKNSWGPSFNSNGSWKGSGFGEMSYYLATKVPFSDEAQSGQYYNASYITSVRSPSQGVLGAGAWMGFWNARMNGQKGVAVLHHTFPYSISINNRATPLVDVFQSASGQTQQLQTVSGSPNAWSIAFNGAPTSPQYTVADAFTLSRAPGAMTATYSDTKTGETETWYKCDPSGSAYALSPTAYAGAASDPYVLPPCGDTTWEKPPAPTCNGSDVAVQSASVMYHGSGSSQPTIVHGSYCLSTSTTVPTCPSGTQLQLDKGANFFPPPVAVSQAEEDICTLDGMTTNMGDSALPVSCEQNPIPVAGSLEFLDNVEDIGGATSAPLAGSSMLFQQGPDHCLSSVYPSLPFSCPAGSVMQTNGDCLIQTSPSACVFWNQDCGYPQVSPPALGDWSPGYYKGQCALGRPVIGVSRFVNAVESHEVECGAESIYTDPSGDQCNFREAHSYDNRGTTDNGTDWDPANYKTECAPNEYVAGVSQGANGVVTGILCCGGTVAHNSCAAQVFYNNNSPAFSGADWDPGYYKGQCPAGDYVAGISTPAFSSVGTAGAAHAILCCAP